MLDGHELNIGKALRQPGIHRSDIFISTNIWNLSNRPCDVKEALDESLAKLGLEYVDLLYLENRDSISTICNGRQDGYLLAPGAPDIWAVSITICLFPRASFDISDTIEYGEIK